MSYACIPIRTHLVRPGEDIAGVVERYVGRIAEPGDVVAISESVVAIAQGRAIPYLNVRPGLAARLLSRLPNKEGSMGTPQAMQLAINEAGLPRVLLGVAAAGLGRLIGRRGVFFLVAGRDLAQIDDIAGTLPPYDDCITLGPKDPAAVARQIKERVGIDTAIVDANDIGKVDVLGLSGGITVRELEELLAPNPAGNDDQKTPIVLLRPRREGSGND